MFIVKVNPGDIGNIELCLILLHHLFFCFLISLSLISPSVNLHCSVNVILSQRSSNKSFQFTSPSCLPISLSIQQCGAVLNLYAALCIFSIALSPRGAKAHLLAGLVWQPWLQHIQNSTLT